MGALLVFFVLPTLIGLISVALIRALKPASLVAAIGAPLVVFLCIEVLDPEDAWNWLAALLVSPLVMGIAVITVMLCCRGLARHQDDFRRIH